MSLDPRTLFVTSLLLALCLTLLVHRSARTFPSIAGALVHWSGGTLLMVAGGVLLLLRGVASDLLSIVVANTVFIAGVILTGHAMARFNDRAYPTKALFALLPALPLALAWFTWGKPDFQARALAVHLYSCTAMSVATVALARGKAGHPRGFPDSFATATALVLSVGTGWRVVDALVVPDPSGSPFDVGTATALFIGLNTVAGLVMPSGLLLMVGDRVAFEFERRATHDVLTGALNRRGFAECAAAERARAVRRGTPLALLLLDLDRFKEINDRHGHAAGDAVLARFVALARGTLRAPDLLSRHGGEEFVVLLPETDLAGARLAAERIRTALSVAAFEVDGATLRATVSVGVAAWRADESLADVTRRADAALYRAKDAGRDRVEIDG